MLRPMGTETDNLDWERLVGDWVTARCRKRVRNPEKPTPDYVKLWLKTIDWNPHAEDTEAPAPVLGWVVKTIEDPDWPRAH